MMKNKIIRSIFIVLALIMVLSTAACFKPKPIEVTDEEIQKVLAHLLPAAEELNVIYYGEGLPTREAVEGAVYLELAPEAKYKTSEELRQATFAVFSNDLATQMYTIGVQGYYDEEQEELGEELGIDMGLSSRYTDMLGIFCMRAAKKEPAIDLGREYDIDSATITEKGATFVTVKIMSEKDGEKLEIELRLVTTESQEKIAEKENGTTEAEITDIIPETTSTPETSAPTNPADPAFWKIDTPTY